MGIPIAVWIAVWIMVCSSQVLSGRYGMWKIPDDLDSAKGMRLVYERRIREGAGNVRLWQRRVDALNERMPELEEKRRLENLKDMERRNLGLAAFSPAEQEHIERIAAKLAAASTEDKSDRILESQEIAVSKIVDDLGAIKQATEGYLPEESRQAMEETLAAAWKLHHSIGRERERRGVAEHKNVGRTRNWGPRSR